MRRARKAIRASKRMAIISAVPATGAIAGTGTVLADAGVLFSGSDNS